MDFGKYKSSYSKVCERMKKLKNRISNLWKMVFLLFLAFLTFSYAMFQGGFVSWFLFYSFLPFGLYSLIITVYPLKNIRVERILSHHELTAGEMLKVTIKIKAPSIIPLFYMIIEEKNSRKLNERTGKTFKFLLFPFLRREIVHQYVIQNIPRGEYMFQGLRIQTSDFLGLTEKDYFYQVENHFLVYPSFVNLDYRSLENRFEQGMTATRDKVQRDTSMAIGVREYQPGDRFSWINWKATAKKSEIMTKEFEQKQTHDVLLLLDREPNDRFNTMVEFAASLVRAVLRKGALVGLLSQGLEREYFPMRGGQAQQRVLFYHLAKVEDDAKVNVANVIENESKLLNQSVTLIIIVPYVHESLIEKLSFLSLRYMNVVIFSIKRQGTPMSDIEIRNISYAKARGIFVKVIHEGHFEEAFVGVK